MERIRIANQSGKALRVFSADGLAVAPSGPRIAPGETLELPVEEGRETRGWANITLDVTPNQWVLLWWGSDGANAQAHNGDRGSPLLLGAKVEVSSSTCEVSISGIGLVHEAAVAPGLHATIVIPWTTWSIDEVATRFRYVVDDDELLQNWAIRVVREAHGPADRALHGPLKRGRRNGGAARRTGSSVRDSLP